MVPGFKLLEEVEDGQIVLQPLDLASLESVRECAKNVNETEERLDVLINNAGWLQSSSSWQRPRTDQFKVFKYLL